MDNMNRVYQDNGISTNTQPTFEGVKIGEDTVTIPLAEYQELKEKAAKWDISQLITIQALYGTHALDLINKELYEHDEKELASTIMKALSGAIKTGGIRIVKKEDAEEEI